MVTVAIGMVIDVVIMTVKVTLEALFNLVCRHKCGQHNDRTEPAHPRACARLQKTYKQYRTILSKTVEDEEPHCRAEQLASPTVFQRGGMGVETIHWSVPS